jgi:hypothetical protein
MPSGETRKARRELPPPLPPGERTVGQLVGEALRAYGARFWRSLGLGLPVVVVNAAAWGASSSSERALVVAPLLATLVPLSYVAACVLVLRPAVGWGRVVVAYGVAVLVFLPIPLLASFYVLPAVAWFAATGLSVPAVLVERLGVRAALVRGVQLARADFVHALGGLATLALVVFLTQAGLYFVLREYAENTQRAAAALASLVVSPLVFLGAALLYTDQEARLRSRGERRKERDADVPDAHDADREGRPDSARQPGPAA